MRSRVHYTLRGVGGGKGDSMRGVRRGATSIGAMRDALVEGEGGESMGARRKSIKQRRE